MGSLPTRRVGLRLRNCPHTLTRDVSQVCLNADNQTVKLGQVCCWNGMSVDWPRPLLKIMLWFPFLPSPSPSQALGISRDVIDKYLVCAGPSQTPLGQVLLAVGE